MKADTPQNKGDSANASCLDYERLPTSLYSKLRTATVARPEVFAFNDALSTSLGLDDAWINRIRQVPHKPDPDASRHDREMQIYRQAE